MGLIAKEFEHDANWLKDRLTHFFRFDHLEHETGIAILTGLEPAHRNAAANYGNNEDKIKFLELGTRLLNGDVIGGFMKSEKGEPSFHEMYSQDEYDDFLEKATNRFRPFAFQYCQLLQYWNSGKHPDRTPPSYFVEWALSKNFRPAWLDRAIEFGLYVPKQETEIPPQPKVKQSVNSDFQQTKWRKAFEYESEGLNALYDLIERHYFDANGNPIYDPAQWALKKNLESDWLTGRTKEEADTIITSSKRKGKAEK